MLSDSDTIRACARTSSPCTHLLKPAHTLLQKKHTPKRALDQLDRVLGNVLIDYVLENIDVYKDQKFTYEFKENTTTPHVSNRFVYSLCRPRTPRLSIA